MGLRIGRVAKANETLRRLFPHHTDERLAGSQHDQVTAPIPQLILSVRCAAIGLKGRHIELIHYLPSLTDFRPKPMNITWKASQYA
jgi:hypothetical protein